MNKAGVRAHLLSDVHCVVVEAPAGCGKTREAATVAAHASASLPRHQEVLLLAHTNGAIHEFRSRVRGARVRAATLDSFALELIRPYARALGLSDPIRPDSPGGPSFAELAPKLRELLMRAPSVARAIAAHYPLIILDEHQDARSDQHDFIRRIAASGDVRLRIFGDPMQSIYSFGGDLVAWNDVLQDADVCESLDTPWRWGVKPDLGEWILKVRETLMNGGNIELGSMPAEVSVLYVEEDRSGANPFSRRVPHELLGPLKNTLKERTGRVGILTRTNDHAFGVRTGIAYSGVHLYEGVDASGAYDAMERLIIADGKAEQLAREVVAIVVSASSGLTAAHQAALNRAIGQMGLARRSKILSQVLDTLEPLYDEPHLQTVGRVLQEMLKDTPPPLRLHAPEAIRVLSELRDLQPGEDPHEVLDRVTGMRRFRGHLPIRCVTTVHKAKGREFDHVVLVHLGKKGYGDTDEDRKLLYVALSRAQESITLVLPKKDASELFTP